MSPTQATVTVITLDYDRARATLADLERHAAEAVTHAQWCAAQPVIPFATAPVEAPPPREDFTAEAVAALEDVAHLRRTFEALLEAARPRPRPVAPPDQLSRAAAEVIARGVLDLFLRELETGTYDGLAGGRAGHAAFRTVGRVVANQVGDDIAEALAGRIKPAPAVVR